MSCNYSSFLIGFVLVIVCVSLAHQMFYTPTNTLQQYIMFSVDPTTNRPMHLVLFHDDRRALYKKINHAKTKTNQSTHSTRNHWKLCAYRWEPHTNTLLYNVFDSDTTKQQSITFQTIDSHTTPSTLHKAYVAYSNDDRQTSYLWKPTKNTFECKSLHGKLIRIKANTKQSTQVPFDAVHIISNKQARLHTRSSQWIDCSLTCRKSNGRDAVRKYDAVLYLRPIPHKKKNTIEKKIARVILRLGVDSSVLQWSRSNR